VLTLASCGEASHTSEAPPPYGGPCEGTATCPSGCESDEERPGPLDPRCGAGRCVDGGCTLKAISGPVASQRYGDCQAVYCTPDGLASSIDDPGDYYDDGRPCTQDRCENGAPINEPFPPGSPYPISGETGVCYEGERFDCIVGNGEICSEGYCLPAIGGQVGEGGYCGPGSCTNNAIDPGEAGKDCGGICHRPCMIDSPCINDGDCVSSVCKGTPKRCITPTCFDGRKNGDESGVDCGGSSMCGTCPDGRGCLVRADCSSGVCKSGQCQAPACFDAAHNGDELAVDCGRGCVLPCP